MLEKILEQFDDFTIIDGYDAAIIGYDIFNNTIIYSYKECINILIDEGMDEIDAIEHFSFNILSSYVGENSPIICMDKL